MGKKLIISTILILLILYVNAQSFDYVGAAQTYWKYRYRLVGDYIQSDSLAWGGEPGFLIRGEGTPGCGLSSPARGRTEYMTWTTTAANGMTTTNNNLASNYAGAFNPNYYNPGAGPCANQGIFPPNASYQTYGILNWTDGQGTDLGRYLAVLATEWKLLHDNNESTAKTELELYYALKAFNRLEEYAFTEYGQAAQKNGLFNRDDVPAAIADAVTNSPGLPAGTSYKNFSSQYNNVTSYGACADFSCPTGTNPGLMSKDQAIRMMFGLAFVSRCIPAGTLGSDWGPYTISTDPGYSSYDLKAEAQAAMQRIIYWMSGNSGWLAGFYPLWFIEDPNNGLVCLGNTALGEAYGLTNAGMNFTDPPYNFTNSYSQGFLGKAAYILAFSDQLFDNNYLPWINSVSSDYETDLLIMAGPLVHGSSYSFFAGLLNAFCPGHHCGDRIEQRKWSKGIYNEGIGIDYPYMDMEAAFLWAYDPYGSQQQVESILTQNPIDATHPYISNNQNSPFPCYMPLIDYNASTSIHRSAANIPLGEQFNGLDYMLFYNLYCIHWGGTYHSGGAKYLDVADAKVTAYSDLQDRIVKTSYPIDLNAVGLPHVPSYRYLGTSTNPLYVGAETSMTFQNGCVATSGAHVNFVAPHMGAPYTTQGAYNQNTHFWAMPGSVVTLNNGRPPCGSATIPGTTFEDKIVLEDTVDETPFRHLIDSLTIEHLNGTLKYTDDSTLQDVSYTLNVYPNPFSTECKVALMLPTSATVSMELYDTYGRDLFTVLSQSQLDEGEHNYLIERDGLVTGAYMLVTYINNKRFVTKLTVI